MALKRNRKSLESLMQKFVSIAPAGVGGGETEVKGVSKALRGLYMVSKGKGKGENTRSPSMDLLY